MISPNVRKDGFQHPRIFGLWNPQSGKVLLVKSKILGFGICDSRNPESCWQLESRWKFHIWQVLRKAVPGMWFHSVESRIHDCLGFPYYVWKSHVRLLFVEKKNVTDIFIKTLICFFLFFSCSTSEDCDECGDYVRHVFSIVTGSLAVISLLIVLFFQESKSTQKINGEDSL